MAAGRWVFLAVSFVIVIALAAGVNRIEHQAGLVLLCIIGAVCMAMTEMTHRAERRSDRMAQALHDNQERLRLTLASSEEMEKHASERLNLALEVSRMGVWEWNLQNNQVWWSGGLEPLHGLAPGSFGGTREAFQKLIHPDDRDAVILATTRAINSRSDYDMEFRVVWPDGSIHWMAGKGRVICDPKLRPLRLVGVGMDITQRKEAEASLRKSAEDCRVLADKLKEADRRKDEFLAMLAHELRNPLAPIRNALQIMRLSRTDSESSRNAQAVIERQVQQMVRLVDDLLDVSRLTRNKLSLNLHKRRITLAEVLKNAIETARPVIEELHHKLTISMPVEPIYVSADLIRLAQVFGNLLHNAAKYTDPGGQIRLKVELRSGEVVVSVKDNGIGMARESQTRLFEMFAQLTSPKEGTQGGLGIGLALSRALVEMHGGRIEARSEGMGQGSEFVVHLPMLPVLAGFEDPDTATPAIPARAVPAIKGFRILVVDDNRDALDSLATMLRLSGHRVFTAENGLDAVDAAAMFRPDVVLLDIGLPKLNGYEAARRIRQIEGLRNTVLIALTGWGQESDKRRAREAGFDCHLTKPVDPNALLVVLSTREAQQPKRLSA